jgi:hypothetical protein
MANIYVRKSGSDSNDGSTPALAVLTPEYAYSIASNEDSIIIGAGIYHITSGMSGKYLTFFGDITGEYTGDAGEVILDGLNSTYDAYNTITTVIDSNFLSNTTYVKNIIFQHIKATCILKGNLDIDNCFISKCFASTFINSSHRNISMKDLIISDSFNNTTMNAIRVDSYNNDANVVMDNVLIKNLHTYGSGDIRGIYFSAANSTLSITMKNVSVENLYAEDSATGLNTLDYQTSGTVNLVLYNCNFINNEQNVGIAPSGGWVVYTTTYNCNSAMSVSADYWAANTTHNNLTNKANYTIPKIEPISRFSPLKGQGYTTFPSTDIEGNPRPAYGNGTACDVGVSEATSDIIQKESTIKDSGDYSVKIAPCNYFKKTFQVPVTASELRTVKVKIRIDGTWGSYLPRISLSGQGMTLSTATKNATTGSFEELTVSGTPTSTGIALLTVEAHSTSTDAIMYLDTITIE